MPRPEAGDRLRRLLSILPWLANKGRASIAEISERTAMAPSEVVAMLELAACCGLPPYTPDQLLELIVDDEAVQADVGPLLSRPMRFSAAEGFTLAASARAILAVPGSDPDGSLARALTKLEAALGDHSRLAIDIDEPPELAVVRQAAADSERLEIDYYSASRDRQSRRLVDPYSVTSADGHWYLDGWCHSAMGTRRFRIDRINGVRRTAEHFDALDAPGGLVAVPQPGSAFVPGPEATRVRLLVPQGAEWVTDALAVQDARKRPDGQTEAVLMVGGRAWLERLLLQMGPGAAVLEPAEWGGLGAGAAQRLLSKYG